MENEWDSNAYTICWEGHGYFGRGTARLDAATASRECARLNRTYPHIRHWAEIAAPDTTTSPSVPDGPPPSFAARLYHAWAVNDLRMFEAVCADVPLSDMRLLAQRLMRMSTEVRMLIDARTGSEAVDSHET
jgi:hypothetical protein